MKKLKEDVLPTEWYLCEGCRYEAEDEDSPHCYTCSGVIKVKESEESK